MQRREFLFGATALASAACVPALAQGFPVKPITLYCPFTAGGPTDVLFRAMAQVATVRLGQNVIVENRPGAAGTLPAAIMRRSAPDGYTLTQMPMGMFRVPQMQKQPTFDPLSDFTYIINLTGYTMGMVVQSSSPFKTVKDVVDFAKANPGKLNYGSTGVGAGPHLAMEQFAELAGISLNHVPFKGSADMLPALLGGHVMMGTDTSGWAPYVDDGRLRLLATYGSKRTKRWPHVATLEEQGYHVVSDSPFGITGPKGMDPAIVRVIHDAFRAALADPRVAELLDRFDQPVIYMDPAEYAKWARKIYAEEGALIERLGLKASL